MISHAKAHWQRTMAAAQAPEGDTTSTANASAYEFMLVKLAEDKRRLKELKSIERKAEVKAKLLHEYQPWIEGVLAGDSSRQDDVLMTVVWTIDIGDFAATLTIGEYAIRHGLTIPDQYKRDMPCVLAEEIAETALKETDEVRAAILPMLLTASGLVEREDIPDEVRTKLCKAIGYAYRAAGDLPMASSALTRALELHSKVGAKCDIELIERSIKNSAPPEKERTPQPRSSDGTLGYLLGLKPPPDHRALDR